MTTQELIELLEEAAVEGLRTDYRGRGMFGNMCLGFIIPSQTSVASIVARIFTTAMYGVYNVEDTREKAEELEILFQGSRTDSMGRDTIMYFPRHKTSESEKEEK